MNFGLGTAFSKGPGSTFLKVRVQVQVGFIKCVLRCFFNLLISILSRGGSKAPVGTTIDFFVTTANDSQLRTIVTKSFILDATYFLDTPLITSFPKDLHTLCFIVRTVLYRELAWCQYADQFSKLHAFRAFAPYVPSCPTRLRALRTFVPYAPSRLTYLRTLRVFAPYVPYSRALPTPLSRALHALFVHVEIVLGWIFSPAKTSKNSKELFQELLKELLIVLF